MSCINRKTLAKYSERQQRFLLTAVGQKFYMEYLCRHGNHTFNLSNTGGGKTQRNYWLVDFLRHSENIIWLSTGKTDEILPLLFMGCKVRIIIPENADFNIVGIENAPTQPEIVRVRSPSEAWWSVWGPEWDRNRNESFNKITIFEFRNTISPEIRSEWMAELFTELAEWSREGIMPKIFPCSIFLDEAQWVLAGTRITTDKTRNKTAEIITENVLEIRSIGGRLIFSAQDFKNVTPASREQMLNAILGRNAHISTEENTEWAAACGDWRRGIKSTSTFKRECARFIFDDGKFYSPPPASWSDPWKFPLYPLDEEDREKLTNMTVRYGRKFTGITETEKEKTELSPQLGRFSHLAIPPEEQEQFGLSRYDQGCMPNDD